MDKVNFNNSMTKFPLVGENLRLNNSSEIKSPQNSGENIDIYDKLDRTYKHYG